MPSGLKGYNFYFDGVKVNPEPIPEGGSFPLTGLVAGTDYSGRIKVTAIDNAGNETEVPVSLEDLSIEAKTTTPSEDDPLPIELQNAIDSIVATKIKPENKPDGCLLHIKTPLGSYAKAYGGDRTAGQPLTMDDNTRYGSISKLPVNTLILREIDRGHLSFDDTVDMFVSGIPNGDKITIKHLLLMQSGLKDWLQQDPAVQQQYFLSPTATFDPVAYIRNTPPIFEPGTQNVYSNSNQVVMGMILEWCDVQFYGKSRTRRQIVLEEFFVANGMPDVEWPTTNYPKSPYMRAWTANLALPQIQAMLGPFAFLAGFLGYPTASELEWSAVNTTYSDAAGSLGGTMRDLVKFGEVMRDGEMLSEEMRKLVDDTFVTYLTYTPNGEHQGPGWMGFGLNMIEWGWWRGWVGGLGAYHSVLFWNTMDGSIIALSQNYFGSEVVDLFYQIAYLLNPESTHLRVRKISPEPIASGAAVGAPTVYIAVDPGDEDGKVDIPLKVPFYV